MASSDATTSPRRARQLSLAAYLVALAAFVLALVRWFAQRAALDGEGAMYTVLERTFLVEDALLGFVVADGTWFWLGLDVVGILAGVLAALVVLAVLVRRFGGRWPRASVAVAAGALALAVGSLVPPVLALASGLPPDGVLTRVPSLAGDGSGEEASFESGTAGRYSVARSQVSTVVARVTAGGEAFDVTFAAPQGGATFDPTALGAVTDARFVVDVSTLDSGIALRNDHAREYLQEPSHPTLTLELAKLDALRRNETGDAVGFESVATLQMMGKSLEVPLRGRIVQLADAASRERVGLAPDGGPEAYLVHVEFVLSIPQTPLAAEREAFDSADIPLNVRVLLVRDAE